MKLLRFKGESGARLGVLTEAGIVPLDSLADTFPTMLSIIAGGDAALAAVRATVAAPKGLLPLDQVHLLAPIERPGKFLAIGLNYQKHADEAADLGAERPEKQLWFNKQTTCLAGPYDDIDPGVSHAVDYEVEIAAIIGKPAKGVAASDAPAHVFGYTVANDVTARDWQIHSPTYTVGKSFDTHGPIGPWIVTADEIGDPHNLRLRCWVNDDLRQDANSSEMIFNLWQQIAYLSAAFTLEPGDILATGTPDGIGAAMNPRTFLKQGDVVRCDVEKIGTIQNRVASSAT